MSPSTQSSGYSPHYIIFGREMPLPIDISLLPKEVLEKAPKEYIDDLIYKVKIIKHLTKEHVRETQKKNKERYHDKNTKESEFKLRDEVLLKSLLHYTAKHKRTPNVL
jgi:ABC-type proline/glycine betaine transport system ATPase subunit